MKMTRVTMILLACASSAGASLRASAGKAAQPAPDSALVRGDPYADNDDFDAPDFADDDREPTAEEEGVDDETLQPRQVQIVAPVRKLQLHQAGVDHSPLPWEDEEEDEVSPVPMARLAGIRPQPMLHKIRRPTFQRAAQRPTVPRGDDSDPASTDFLRMLDEPTQISAAPEDNARLGGSSGVPEDASGNGEGEEDTDAMMMYYQGKVRSMQAQNKHLKGMLSKAAAWGKGMKEKAGALDAQRQLNAQLRAQVQSFQAAGAQTQNQLRAEQKKEATLEDNVQALQWVQDQRAAAQRDNAALKQQLQNATQEETDLQVQFAASKRDRDAADAAQQQAVADLKAERQQFQAKQKELALAKAEQAKEEAELAAASMSGAEVGQLQQVVEQRNELLRKGLNQLVSERDREQKLKDQAADQDKELQAQLTAARSNETALEKQLAEQNAKEQELEKAVAMTRRHVAEGAAEQKKAEKAARRARAELGRTKAVDKKIQANSNWLKKQAADERLAAQNATQETELANEARLAARKELASADSVIARLRQEHAAAMAENTKLTRAIAKSEKESAQLKLDAAPSYDDATAPAPDGASTEPAVAEPAVATEDAPDDLPTMDVVAP